MNKKYVKHLSLEDRKNIELGITERLCKSQIAKKINRSTSTLAEDIYSNTSKSKPPVLRVVIILTLFDLILKITKMSSSKE